MYVLAISDTHLADDTLLPKLIRLANGAQWIFHAGDFDTKTAYENMKALFKDKLVAVNGNKLVAVKGNTNEDPDLPLDPEIPKIVEGIKIGVVHKFSPDSTDTFFENVAEDKAIAMGVDVLIFGHIHQPIVAWGNKLLICPGRGTKYASIKKCKYVTAAQISIDKGKVTGVKIIRF
jgi:hypothetical protein